MESNANFADMYLHPFEIDFTISELFTLINSSDLKFVAFSNPKTWSIGRLLSGKLLERALTINQLQRFQLIEDLVSRIDYFDLFLSKESLDIYDWSNDVNILSSSARISRSFGG